MKVIHTKQQKIIYTTKESKEGLKIWMAIAEEQVIDLKVKFEV